MNSLRYLAALFLLFTIQLSAGKDAKMYPTFTLVGPDGMIVTGGCPFPSENLERIIAVKTAPHGL